MECYLSAFGHLPRSAPKSAQRVLFECFLTRKRQKALKKHSLGHSEAGAQKHSKSTPWGSFQPGPPSTPVNGCRDRNSKTRVSGRRVPNAKPQKRLRFRSLRGKTQSLDGRNRAIVIAESLARVIAAIRIASVRWRSYLP